MFRFTIRELVLVTIIAALAAGWMVEASQRTRGTWECRAQALAEFWREDGWAVSWDPRGVSLERPNRHRSVQWGIPRRNMWGDESAREVPTQQNSYSSHESIVPAP